LGEPVEEACVTTSSNGKRQRGRAGRPPNVEVFPDGRPDGSGLTPRQRRVLEVIRDSVERRGYPPSMREIGEAVGLTSVSSVSYQLRQLQAKGLLRRDPNRPRAVEVRPAPADAGDIPYDETGSGDSRPVPTYVPVVGRIAAGGPVLAEQAVEDVFALPRQLVGDGQLFLLKVAADNGEIVAAMIDGEATVKTYKRRDDHVWLLPHNASYEPIPGDQATILGRVVAVLRSV
jgi:repressor LexA